jgi:hypothetical protein
MYRAVVCRPLHRLGSASVPECWKLNARDADDATIALAREQTAKQQCMSTCRARYRDCRRLNQLPSVECRGVYQDCTRYSCTGLGPG